MKKLKYLTYFFIAGTFFFIYLFFYSSSVQAQCYSRVKIFSTQNDILKTDLAPIYLKKNDINSFVAEIPREDLQKLSDKNISYQILIEDLNAFYENRNAHKSEPSPKSSNSCFSRLRNYATPQYFRLGEMGGFLTLYEIYAQLDTMRLLFPNLITQKQNIGTFQSVEGRPLYFIKISNTPDSVTNKPQVLFTALHHAMEPMGMQQLFFFMYYLLENYGVNPEVTYLMDNLEFYFIPVVNPDGYAYNEAQAPNGGGTWRKNRRPNGLFNGVDLNRNYGSYFAYDGIGSSNIGIHPWYRGDSAFSEPETQALDYFLSNHHFKSAVNWHAYGNFIIYPWNYSNIYTQDSVLFEKYSRILTYENPYNYGTCYETYGYQSNGDADDWGYTDNLNRHKILSLTAETGSTSDGFWPQSGNIEQLSKEAISIDLAFSKLCLGYAQIADLSSSIITQPYGYLHYSIECLGLDTPSTFTVSFIPMSSDITFSSPPATYSQMHLLDQYTDSVYYTLNCAPGSSITFLRNINNGNYTFTDTITKYYFPASTVIFDSCHTMANWSSNVWDISNTEYYSPAGSITESSSGNYGNYQTSELIFTSPVNLQSAVKAVINFRAKWNLENNFDYIELYASTDNGTSWSPLCGNHSEQGSANEDLQQPIYDAMQPSWIFEEIPLDDYLGNTILLKFAFKSNLSNTCDGFYLDDFEIRIADSITTNIKTINLLDEMAVYPNPTSKNIIIENNAQNKDATVLIYNIQGQLLLQKTLPYEKTVLDISHLAKGVYIVKLSNYSHTKVVKIVKK